MSLACWAPLSMEFSRQEYWSGFLFPSPGDLPDPGIEPRSPALQADSLPTELWGKPLKSIISLFFLIALKIHTSFFPVPYRLKKSLSSNVASNSMKKYLTICIHHDPLSATNCTAHLPRQLALHFHQYCPMLSGPFSIC